MSIVLPYGGGGLDPNDLTAKASDVIKGKIAGVNGCDVPIEGTLEIQSVTNFNVAQYSSLTLLASWALPVKGPWSGIRIMCKQENYPVNPYDGTLFYEGSAASATKALAAGTWYFRAWNYMNTNYGRMYGSYHDKTASNVQIRGQQVFTGSTAWTVPSGVYSIDAFCVGGGSAGESGYDNKVYYAGTGGASGKTATRKAISVSPGQTISITVGSGGGFLNSGLYNNGPYTSQGGTTSIGGYVSAAGGYHQTAGGNTGTIETNIGGSGGGQDYSNSGYDKGGGGSGGTNGTNGWTAYCTGYYGSSLLSKVGGQNTTTRAFSEGSGTLYAGGGGGGCGSYGDGFSGGAGGAGGGGAGGVGNRNGVAGTAGTGGGGGGGGGRWGTGGSRGIGGNGGSGIAIIRWGY